MTNPHPTFVDLKGDERIDEIRMKVEPRFKTSELSGDEWRTSVEVTVFRKGIEVGSRSWGRFEHLFPRLQAWLDTLSTPDTDADLCMQPGCDEPWTVEYRMVERGCSICGHTKTPDPEWFDYRRRFCRTHALRGDSHLDDSDRNYVLLPTFNGALAPDATTEAGNP